MNEHQVRNQIHQAVNRITKAAEPNPFLAQWIMNQERTKKPVMKKKLSIAFILAVILTVACIATAVAGATSETFNTWLYQIWPEAALKLMPVNLACDSEEIRMEVISAVAKDNEVYITFSMQDLEGDRISENSYPSLEVYYTDDNADMDYDIIMPSLYDAEEKKIIFGQHYSYASVPSSPDNTIAARVDALCTQEHRTVDLLPLLKEYGSEAKFVPAPQDGIVSGSYNDGHLSIKLGNINEREPIPESMKVLDYHNGLEIPVAEDVFLSGIGMVDGQLHVQLHYTADNSFQAPIFSSGEVNILTASPYEIWVILCDDDEKESLYASEKYRQADKLPGGITHLDWYADESGQESWKEFIFTPDTELTDAQNFVIDITKQLAPPIAGSWQVDFPVRLIKNAQ